MPRLYQGSDGCYYIRHYYLDFNTWQIDRDGFKYLSENYGIDLGDEFPQRFPICGFFELHDLKLIYTGNSRKAYWREHDLTREPTLKSKPHSTKLNAPSFVVPPDQKHWRWSQVARKFIKRLFKLSVKSNGMPFNPDDSFSSSSEPFTCDETQAPEQIRQPKRKHYDKWLG